MKRNALGLVIILMIFILMCGCASVEVERHDSVEMYSRKDVEYTSSSETFGKGMGDDIYVALQYIYNNEELKEKFGASFEIIPENVICYSSEGSTRFFYMYKGNADYGFRFEQEIYRVKLSKSYKGKWNVDSGKFEVEMNNTIE